MNTFITISIFLIILFLYIQIIHQYKKSEDLEIYEMDYSSNIQLQEVCEIKQPVLFEYKSHNPHFYETVTYDDLLDTTFSDIDVKVKDINDYWNSDNTVDYAILPFKSAETLISSDTKESYFTENNQDFIEESGLLKSIQENDSNLKPTMVCYSKYDVITGSKNTVTPLRYHVNYRKFISVNSGKIHIKMTPWKSSKYLYKIKDYETFEFRSPINAWKPQKKYLHEMDKIKFLEFDVNPGYILSIPPYWWYSIKFGKDSDALLCEFNYTSIMNSISNLPEYSKYYLQQHNIKKRITKTLDIIKEKEKDLESELEVTEQ